jgi:hypothetical protein
MKPDDVQWILVCELVKAHPQALTVDDLRLHHPGEDVEETIARLQIDGLAIRFGDWVKASEPAVRFDQLSRSVPKANVHDLNPRAA